MGNIRIYDWGDHGVDLVSSPIHAKDGSFQRLQNGEFSDIQGQGGVKKRGSLTRLNTSPLNGGANVLALFNMPLETDAFDSVERAILYPLDTGHPEGGGYWRTSSNGSSFSAPAAMTAGYSVLGPGFDNSVDAAHAGVISGVLYFLSGGNLYSWDGTTLTLLVALAAFPAVNGSAGTPAGLIAVGTTLYIAAANAVSEHTAFSMVPASGTTLTQVGNVLSSVPASNVCTIAYAFGSLWLLQAVIDSGLASTQRIYRCQPGVESSWTLDFTFGAGRNIVSLSATGGGALLAGATATDGAYPTSGAGVIYRCTGNGAWTIVKTHPSAANFTGWLTFANHPTGGASSGPAVFAFYVNFATVCDVYVSEDDGVTWASDQDFIASFAVGTTLTPGIATVFGGLLFVPFWDSLGTETGFLAVRTAPGVWEQRETSKAVGPLAVTM